MNIRKEKFYPRSQDFSLEGSREKPWERGWGRLRHNSRLDNSHVTNM